MPGPSNAKKKRKAQAKKRKEKERRAAQTKAQDETHDEPYEKADDEVEIRVEAEDDVPEYEVEEVPEPRERYRPLKSQPLRYMSRPARHAHAREHCGRHARHGPRGRSHSAGPPAHSAFSSSTDSPSPGALQYRCLPPPAEPQCRAGMRDGARVQPEEPGAYDDVGVPAPPCVTDQGNGPHVNDVRAFLASRLCSAPSLDDALCAEFAREEVREMLGAVLPEDMALILWHNKSRARARICPACRRLYRLGELVREPLLDDGSPVRLPDEGESARADAQAQRRRREQEISGICSALCFMLVAHRYPAVLRGCWGRVGDELADATWDELDAPLPRSAADEGLGFSMVLKMTRCHDLGLGQLFGVDDDGEGADGDEDEDEAEDPEEY